MSEALGEINQAVESGADIVELRIDFLRSFNAARDIRVLLDACPVPCIVTYRPAWEGGQYEGEEEPRLAALWTAVECGAAYIDCELLAAGEFFAAAPEGTRERSATQIILSSHNYENVPSEEELAKIHAQCVAAGADIVKIAAMVNDVTQVARLESLLAGAKCFSGQDTIVLGMGEAGQVSRLLAAKFGSFFDIWSSSFWRRVCTRTTNTRTATGHISLAKAKHQNESHGRDWEPNIAEQIPCPAQYIFGSGRPRCMLCPSTCK